MLEPKGQPEVTVNTTQDAPAEEVAQNGVAQGEITHSDMTHDDASQADASQAGAAENDPTQDGAAPRGELLQTTALIPAPTPKRVRPFRLFVLLLGLLAALYVYRTAIPPVPEPMLVQRGFSALPELQRPEGALLSVFEAARPAALQIEVRAEALALSSAPQGIGTGFFISPDGLVLTAYHVVDPTTGLTGRDVLEAVGPDRTRYGLELVGFDAYLDLAVLQADLAAGTEVPYLPLASYALEVGSEVVAIGNSRGEFLQGRVGEVRRLGVRAARADFADGTSELTASLAPGDSGGPVLNTAGEVVGVVSYIAISAAPPAGPRELPEGVLPDTGDLDGIVPEVERSPFLRLMPRVADTFASYAVPVSLENEVLAGLREGVQRDVPVIGFTLGVASVGQSYNPRTAPNAELGPRPGVVVGDVAEGGPADLAGLRDATEEQIYSETGTLEAIRPVADVVVAVDGERTPTYEALVGVLRRKEIGQTVEVSVQRGGELLVLPLELGGRRAVFNPNP